MWKFLKKTTANKLWSLVPFDNQTTCVIFKVARKCWWEKFHDFKMMINKILTQSHCFQMQQSKKWELLRCNIIHEYFLDLTTTYSFSLLQKVLGMILKYQALEHLFSLAQPICPRVLFLACWTTGTWYIMFFLYHRWCRGVFNI
jgi:hypothetical protein